MGSIYGKLIQHWERRLVARDPHRYRREFDWGWQWLRRTPIDGLPPRLTAPLAVEAGLPLLEAWSRRAIAAGEDFFSAPAVTDYRLEPGEPEAGRKRATFRLTFTSAARSGDRNNDRVVARWLPAQAGPGGRRRAVVILPQWNADAEGHIALARGLQRFGISALRLSLPWHDERKPAGFERAEYAVDSNLGRTIHAARQAVCDTRAACDWLEREGYESLGILGTSLGSCYALLAAAHDRRLRAAVFNHISLWFGDVVGSGLATRHVRESLPAALDDSALRRAWSAISPASYLARLAEREQQRRLLIWARYDLTFLPEYSRQVVAEFRRLGLRHEERVLPCGHNTTGQAPFKFLDGFWMVKFLLQAL